MFMVAGRLAVYQVRVVSKYFVIRLCITFLGSLKCSPWLNISYFIHDTNNSSTQNDSVLSSATHKIFIFWR